MNRLLIKFITLSIVPVVCVLSSVYLLTHGFDFDYWGWFLFVAIIFGQSSTDEK
jgi:hypothetical protein